MLKAQQPSVWRCGFQVVPLRRASACSQQGASFRSCPAFACRYSNAQLLFITCNCCCKNEHSALQLLAWHASSAT